MKLLFVAVNNMGELTGGDTIWINLYKQWKKDHFIEFVACTQAYDLLLNRPGKVTAPTIPNILLNTISRTLFGLSNLSQTTDFDYVYSVSDFYPDLLTALVYKLRNKGCKWIAGYYLVAPSPFAKNSPYKGLYRIKGVLYWLMQKLSLFLVNCYANIVFVTSEPDRKYFPNKKVVVVRGGVNETGHINKEPVYNAIFIGRFHYQKGVLELLDIWRKVVDEIPNARLCMIGDGPLMNEVLRKRFKLGLDNDIDIVGFKAGKEKYELIKNSKLVVHPATFDSGGMACAEAMAFGLPAVGFDLPAYDTYYPKGMVKCRTIEKFAKEIIWLLTDGFAYSVMSNSARYLISDQWLWTNRARDIWKEVTT